jgi:dTDP-4-dehydrorhamnose 3,5-epimerase
MKFEPLPLEGAYLVGLEPRADERGMFARTFCKREFDAHGLRSDLVQCNLSTNVRAGTLRGMHFQSEPFAEVKLIRCVRGAIYDVIVDLREGSATYGRWVGAELSEENGQMMYVPQGFAHGYQALTDGAAAFYMVTEYYAPQAEGGLRYDDPAIRIEWPISVSDISDKDARWPLLGS